MVEIVKSSYEKSIQFKVDDLKDQGIFVNDYLKLVFVLTGTVVLETASCVTEAREEELLAINPYELHQLIYSPSAHTVTLFLGEDIIGKKYLPVVNDLKKSDTAMELLDLKQMFSKMFRLFYKSPELNREEIFSCAYHIIGCLQNTFVDLESEAPVSNAGFDYLERILRYVNEHYASDVSLGMISKKIGLSEGHISRLFRTILKMRFSQYVKEVRLWHAYIEVKAGETSITEIAYSCGFGSSTQMIEAFRAKYGMTPGKLRSRLENKEAGEMQRDTDMFLHLSKYAVSDDEEQEKLPVLRTRLEIHPEKRGVPVKNRFTELLNIGWAKDLLLEPIREQIRKCQKEIGFRFLRCHGVFDDDMMVFHREENGEVSYNFSYVAKAYDFLLSVGLKPFVELGYTPIDMTESEVTWFHKNSRLGIPDFDEWKALLERYFAFCINRYGREEVRSWRFTIMSVLHGYYHNFSYDEYLPFWNLTYKTVKGIDPQFTIGGPGTELSIWLRNDGGVMEKSLEYYINNNCLPDYLSFQVFHVVYDRNYAHTLKLVSHHTIEPIPITDDPDYLSHILERLQKSLQKHGFHKLPLTLECWNSTIWQRDLCNDTCYKSAFLFKNMFDNAAEDICIGYWTMSDLMEELFADPKQFHGGYGMLTRDGIPKSIFSAYELLAQMGEEILERGDGYMITKKKDGSIQVGLYNYSHYDSLSRQNFFTEGSTTSRYRIFQNETIREFRIRFQLPEGDYNIERYGVSRKKFNGSGYDNWVTIGAPDPLSEKQLEYLKQMSRPSFYCENIRVTDHWTLRESLEPHEIRIVKITRKDDR